MREINLKKGGTNMFKEKTTEEILKLIEEEEIEMEEKNIVEKINNYFGNDTSELFIKLAKQLEKVDMLEKEIEELKKRLDRANI